MNSKILRKVKARFKLIPGECGIYSVLDHKEKMAYREINHHEAISRIFSIVLGVYTYLDWCKRKRRTREIAEYQKMLKR